MRNENRREYNMKKYRVYLDNCCFNRPYDNQTSILIRMETDAERFIALLRREPFDYTEWQRTLFQDVPLNQFLKDAESYRKQIKD